MGLMKKVGLGLGGLVIVVGVGAVAAVGWAKSAATTKLATTYEAHQLDFPIPYPLTEAEIAALRSERTTPQAADAGVDVLAGVDLAALATQRAAARGKYLVEARYVCVECHGMDLAGGTMLNDPPVGVVLGKNLTSGKGGAVAGYTPADWDRIVRHGIKRNGNPTLMPSVDFVSMTDRELSDIATYVRSVAPVDREVPEPVYGPVGSFLIATGQMRLGAEYLPRDKPHAVEPPTATSPDFGKHVTQVCVGCHNPQFTGGPVVNGPPDWPPAKNLTPHAEGLAGWTLADFMKAMREGVSRDGRPLREPMASVPKVAQRLEDRELQAMFEYLQSLPPQPTPKP
jgi:mono/diheme cytochrome c family protein